MIQSDKLEIEFVDCNSNEKEILEKYWSCDDDGNFEMTLSNICKNMI